MQTGFITEQVLTLWRSGQPDLLPGGLEFWWRGHRWRHRPGGYTDGLSAPHFIQNLPGCNPRGWAFMPAIVHDGGYHDDLEMFYAPESIWKKFTLTKTECDDLFNDLLASLPLTPLQVSEAHAYVQAVRQFGQPSFDQARKIK